MKELSTMIVVICIIGEYIIITTIWNQAVMPTSLTLMLDMLVM
jgi:hypothetical protein